MSFLSKNNFKVFSLASLYSYLKSHKKIPAKTVVITFDDGYQDNYLNAFPILKEYSFPATVFIPTSLIGKNTIDKEGIKFSVLSRQQIQEMHSSGIIDFGSHCHHHYKLTTLSNKEAEEELFNSKKILKKVLNKEVDFYAYPFGDCNQIVKKVVKRFFTLACGINIGVVNKKSDLLELPRNSIDSGVTFTQFKGIIKFGRI